MYVRVFVHLRTTDNGQPLLISNRCVVGFSYELWQSFMLNSNAENVNAVKYEKHNKTSDFIAKRLFFMLDSVDDCPFSIFQQWKATEMECILWYSDACVPQFSLALSSSSIFWKP